MENLLLGKDAQIDGLQQTIELMQDRMNKMEALLKVKDKKIRKLQEDPSYSPIANKRPSHKIEENVDFEDLSHIRRFSPDPTLPASSSQINLIMAAGGMD